MSLYKRGNIYWIRITTPAGRRIRKSTGSRERKVAQEYHDSIAAELWRIEKLGDKPRRTWQEAVVRWLYENDQKVDTKNDRAKFRWLDPYLGDVHLDNVDRDLIDMIIDVKRREKVAPATVNRYLALIRAVLRSAKLEWDWIDKVPRIRLLKEPTGRVRWITPEEAQRLLKELPTHLAAMARFSFSTGLRQGNVKRLRWSQVDMKGAKAWIDASQSKTGVAIPIPLNSDALAVLSAQIGKHKEFVFVYKGKPQNHIGTKAWYAAKERAGLSDFRWHDIRHTWASWHVQNGTPLHELMVLGGWRVYKTVLRYAHLSTNQLSDAANRIDGLMNTKE